MPLGSRAAGGHKASPSCCAYSASLSPRLGQSPICATYNVTSAIHPLPSFANLPARSHWHVVDFIADLHLKPSEPATFAAWRHYLLHTPADAVFLLGDLFEAWIGDDCATPGSFEAQCAEVLRATGAAIDLLFMPGNRDFLLGSAFLDPCGITLLPDPTVLTLHGVRYLLTHGDLLCTGDTAYQQFRQQVRSPAWQSAFLARPLAERQALARQMRQHSEAHHAQQLGRSSSCPSHGEIDTDLARQWLQAAQAHTLIHGHTHQPADHELGPGPQGQPLRQIVLSDWHLDQHTRRLQVLRLSTTGLYRLTPELPASSQLHA